MRRGRYSEEQIIRALRQVESGQKVQDVIREHGISEQTHYRWRKRYGGTQVSQAKRLKHPEQETTRLEKLLAESMLDKEILEEAASVYY